MHESCPLTVAFGLPVAAFGIYLWTVPSKKLKWFWFAGGLA
jgi:hypothetical protein